MNNLKIGVVGLGYVGLPLAVEFGKKYSTIGFDINQQRIEELQSGIDRTLETSNDELTALMGLAFKPDIDDLRESPAKYIANKVMQSEQNNFLVVEPNIKEHSLFKLTDYLEAYEKADIIVFLVAHKEFKTLEYRDDKMILDFAGIFKR
jgi:UDP-N-acetyl-D-mannosaminuronic acid dehydrogenase